MRLLGSCSGPKMTGIAAEDGRMMSWPWPACEGAGSDQLYARAWDCARVGYNSSQARRANGVVHFIVCAGGLCATPSPGCALRYSQPSQTVRPWHQ